MESCLLRGSGVVPQHFSPRIGNRTFRASCDIAEGNLDPCHFALHHHLSTRNFPASRSALAGLPMSWPAVRLKSESCTIFNKSNHVCSTRRVG